MVRLMILLGVFIALRCAGTKSTPQLSQEEARWETVQRVLQENYDNLRTLSADGKVIIETPEASYTANATIHLKKPDSIYVKIEAAFGIDVGVLFADRHRYVIYTPMQNTVYTGPADSFNLDRFLSFRLSYKKLVQLLSGLETAEPISSGTIHRQENQLLLLSKNGDQPVVHSVDPYNGVVTQTRTYNQNHELVFLAHYSRFSTFDGVRLPKTIRIQRPRQKESITFFYNSVAVNQKIDPDKFTIVVPEKAIKVDL
jgi:outer membrane lipoprotein-sorting protein